MRFLLSFLFFVNSLPLFTQENLVSNGSFELMSHCSSGAADLDGLIDVSKPSLGTSDIWSVDCGTAPIYLYTSVYKPKDGSNFMGFMTNELSPTAYREYIQLKLKNPLIKDRVYEVGGFFKPQGTGSDCSECLEFHLSESQIFVDTACTLPLNADYSCVGKGKMYCDTLNWEKVTGYFTANGNENYLIIGCFKEKGEFLSNNFGPFFTGGSYYYVDSVYVSDPKLYSNLPNIITPNLDDLNDLFEPTNFQADIFHYELWVYNRWGNLVYSGTKPWKGNCSEHKCSSGIYFYVINYYKNADSSLVKTEKGTVTVID